MAVNTFNKLIDGTTNTAVGHTITEIAEFIIALLEAPTVLLGFVEKMVALQGSNGKSWEVLGNAPTVQIRSGLDPVTGWAPEMSSVEVLASLPMVIKYPIYDNVASQWRVDKSDTFRSAVIETLLQYLSSLVAQSVLNAGSSYTCTGTDGKITLDDVDEIAVRMKEAFVTGSVGILKPRAGMHLRKNFRDNAGAAGLVTPEIANPLLKDAFLARYAGLNFFEDQAVYTVKTSTGAPYTYTAHNLFMRPGAVKLLFKDMMSGIEATPGIAKFLYNNPETGISFKITSSPLADPVGTMYMFEATCGVGIPDNRLVMDVQSSWTASA